MELDEKKAITTSLDRLTKVIRANKEVSKAIAEEKEASEK